MSNGYKCLFCYKTSKGMTKAGYLLIVPIEYKSQTFLFNNQWFILTNRVYRKYNFFHNISTIIPSCILVLFSYVKKCSRIKGDKGYFLNTFDQSMFLDKQGSLVLLPR